jgi:cephalosporin-C deacetylase-like acetyl esterase
VYPVRRYNKQEEHKRLFEYDPLSPIEAISSPVERRVQGDLHELSYPLPGSSEYTRAWLIVPHQSRPSPVVVALHGGGQDRNAFLAEAWLLSEIGVASLLIDLPQARVFPNFSRPYEDQDRFARTVLTVRRGFDCLSFRSDVDICRGAIVGFSFGAWIGAIVSAIDARPRSAVLIASVPRMSEFWRASGHPDVVQIRQGLPPGIMDRYAEASKQLDTSEYLQRCADIPLLFQFGTRDEVISDENVREFTPYACGTNQLKVYVSASHYQMFLNPDARRDRFSWLQDKLAPGQ